MAAPRLKEREAFEERDEPAPPPAGPPARLISESPGANIQPPARAAVADGGPPWMRGGVPVEVLPDDLAALPFCAAT